MRQPTQITRVRAYVPHFTPNKENRPWHVVSGDQTLCRHDLTTMVKMPSVDLLSAMADPTLCVVCRALMVGP